MARHSCATPAPGFYACEAEVLASRRTGRLIHPNPTPQPRTGGAIAHIARRHGRHAGHPAPAPMTPAYLQQAYDLTYLSASRGRGDTVAVVDGYDDPNAESDLAKFRRTYGLPPCTTANGCFVKLNERGQRGHYPSTDWSWAQEISLDLDAVSSLCPNCRIMLVEATYPDTYDLQQAIATAVTAGANQISDSWAGEAGANPFSGLSFPGVSILAATGDSGVPPAGYNLYPAALPSVTAVGGTSLNPARRRQPNARGIRETAWGGSSAGCDTQEPRLSYQPATACRGRAYSDISAVADPSTGLNFYDRHAGGWLDGGGSSLATPLVAAFEAITGVDGSTPAWIYRDSAKLNDPSSGSTGRCRAHLLFLCRAKRGYDGPTGAGSISGAIVRGAPGIGLPSLGRADSKTYVRHTGRHGAKLTGGVYPNGERTTYYWQFGRTARYGRHTRRRHLRPHTGPTATRAHLRGLRPGTTYHYRLVARNRSGTAYGYDHTLTTRRRHGRKRHRRHPGRRQHQDHPGSM